MNATLGRWCATVMALTAIAALTSCRPLDIRPEAHTDTLRPLDLTVSMRAERDGRSWRVRPGEALKSGDFLELLVYLNQPAHLYVVQVLPDGISAMLFPEGEDHMLPSGGEYRIPPAPDESFQLDANLGEENIYVLMSRTSIAYAGALISAAHGNAPRTAEDLNTTASPPGPAPGLPVQAAAPLADAQPKNPRLPAKASPALRPGGQRRPDRILTITTRHVLRVKRQGGTPVLVDAARTHDDPTLVVQLSFRHE